MRKIKKRGWKSQWNERRKECKDEGKSIQMIFNILYHVKRLLSAHTATQTRELETDKRTRWSSRIDAIHIEISVVSRFLALNATQITANEQPA